jgi:hypothetical protein
MADEKNVHVEVVRNGYTFGRQGHPKGSVLMMTEAQFKATRQIEPHYVEKITATEFNERSGQVAPVVLDPADRTSSMSPASAAEADRAAAEQEAAEKEAAKAAKAGEGK